MKKNFSLSVFYYFIILSAILLFSHSPLFAQENGIEKQYQPLISGMESYRDGNYEKALEEFQNAAIIFPDNPDIPFYMGLTFLKLNQPDNAIEYFHETLKKDTEYMDAHFQLGVILIQQSLYQDALEHLEKVYEKEPDREDLGYFLGFAYYQLGRYEESLNFLDGARTSDRKIESLVFYYSALVEEQLGEKDNAIADFKQVILTDPTSPLAEPSQRLIETIKLEKRLKKRFSLELSTKFQYDDNVILVPTTDIFNLRDKDRKSLIELIYLRGEYVFLKKPDMDVSLSYGLYQTITNSIKGMDVQDHIFSLDFLKRGVIKTKPYNFRINYSFDYLFSDYSYLLQRHTIRPNFLLMWNQKHLSIFQYALQIKEFKEAPVFTVDNRDAINHEAGITHFLRFNNGKHYVKAGYFYDKEFASGNNWDYQGDKIIAGFQYTLPKDLRLNVDYEYKHVRYQNTNIFFNEKRKDTERSLSAVVSKEIYKNFTLSLEYLRRDNSSNIVLYEYEKNLFSLGVNWRW